MADLSRCRTDSKASRHIICCVPVTSYAFDQQHVNVTLQMLLDVVVEDIHGLSTVGVPNRDHGVPWLYFWKCNDAAYMALGSVCL